MRFRVVHRTSYSYAAPVSATYGEHRLLPRATPTQQIHTSSVAIDPAPDERRERVDLHGNRVEHYEILRDHDHLSVTASSVVTVREPPALVVETPWEEVRDRVRVGADAATLDARALLLDSPQIAASAELRALARPLFESGRSIGDSFRSLLRMIHREFVFDPSATTVTTPIEDVLDRRAGVCQDFAHLAIGCLRSLGLPARYVSGYLETVPPPGASRLQGADASHAWVAVFVPGHGWVDGDPTNDQLVGTRHVTVAWGRDYGDIAPLKGVVYTEGPTERLDVAVDVLRIPADDREPRPSSTGTRS